MPIGQEDPEFPQLLALGLKTHAIIGDGNCQPRSLSDQIYGDQTHHLEIRGKITEEMRRNKQHYEAFCIPEPRVNPVRSRRKMAAAIATAPEFDFDQYLMELSRPGAWLDHPQLVAFAKAYNMEVTVHQKNTSRVVTADERTGVPSCRMLHIAHHKWGHYSSVRSIKTGLPVSSLEPEIKGHRANGTPISKRDVPVPSGKEVAELEGPPSGASDSSPETSRESSLQNLRKRSRSELDLAGLLDDHIVSAGKRQRFGAKALPSSKPVIAKAAIRDNANPVGLSKKHPRANESEASERASKRSKVPESAKATRRNLVKGLRPRSPSEHKDSEDVCVRCPKGRKIFLSDVDYLPSTKRSEPEPLSALAPPKLKKAVQNKYNLKSARKHSSQLPPMSSSTSRLNPKSANLPLKPTAQGKIFSKIQSGMHTAPQQASRPLSRPLSRPVSRPVASPKSKHPLAQSRPAKSGSRSISAK